MEQFYFNFNREEYMKVETHEELPASLFSFEEKKK
jgi:hypothetical protein